MVNSEEQKLNLIFSALSDPTRRAMLRRLGDGEMSVAALSEPFDISKPAVTKHVKVLENAGLLRRTVNGRIHHCRIQVSPLKTASEWMRFYENFWNKKFDALDKYLTDTTGKGKNT